MMIPVSEVQDLEYNLALGKLTRQSKTTSQSHASPRAVIADLTKCAVASKRHGYFWWEVDFGVVYIIWNVDLTSSTSKLKQTSCFLCSFIPTFTVLPAKGKTMHFES